MVSSRPAAATVLVDRLAAAAGEPPADAPMAEVLAAVVQPLGR